jgi:hypothetical protein
MNQTETTVEVKEINRISTEDKKALKSEIRKKYGSMYNFCKIAEISYSRMNMFFVGRLKKESEEKLYSDLKGLVDSLLNQMDNQIMT